MTKKQIFGLFVATFWALTAFAQDEIQPSVSPTANYLDKENQWQETTSIDDGEAPLEVIFRANPKDMGEHTPSYEWHFRKQGEEKEFMVRYEEETTYRFIESGTFDIVLKTTLTDTGEELDSVTIIVAISESKLEFPNAFSPNGDGINDVYKAKEGHRSIVEFHAYIFNRWGQKLFEWTDISKGWDGKYNGTPCKDGVYFVLVKARGADGKEYNIRRDINLIRNFNEVTSTATSNP